MPEDIFGYLDEMPSFTGRADWDGLEKRFLQVAAEFVGPESTRNIAEVDLSRYQHELVAKLHSAIQEATIVNAPAIYFEYDLDNSWSGNFFICESYSPLSDGDDDWACDYSEHLPGPSLPEFSEIYRAAGGFDRTRCQIGTTLLLVARTVAAFGRAAAEVPLGPVNLCLAFHDQDPILRIREQ